MILFNNIDYKPTCELNLNLDLGDFITKKKICTYSPVSVSYNSLRGGWTLSPFAA